MKTLTVPDMHCEMCVKRISNALREAGVEFEVDLKEKTVAVEEGKLRLAMDELADLGFEAKQ